MTSHPDTAKARFATRAAFFVAGFAISCWAPLVPYGKSNVGADEAQLGLLLLCIGIGSVVSMPTTGVLAARLGSRPIILVSGFCISAAVPLLMLPSSFWALAAVLLLLGASLGSLDVSMNIHGAEIEAREGRPLMSGFHAQFSLGGFAGAGLVTGLLSLGVSPAASGVVGGALAAMVMMLATPHFLRAKADEPEPLTFPKGIVVLLAVLTGIMFLVEGAILDWGALLLIERALSETSGAGIGYIVFSVTMVIARLNGDRLVRLVGPFKIMFFGGLATVLGFLTIIYAPSQLVVLGGFGLIGLGASNVVPVLFSLAGRQTVMPPGLAIASISVVGYSGVLLGPALIGFFADWTSLPTAFIVIAILAAIVPVAARKATR